MEASAHALLTSRDCSEDGCTNDASDAPTRGPLANKCGEHREVMRERMREAGRASGSGTPPVPRPAADPGTDPGAALIAATSELHGAARALADKARKRVAARDAAKGALAEFNDALIAVKRTAEQLLAQ